MRATKKEGIADIYQVILANGSRSVYCTFCLPAKYKKGGGTIKMDVTSQFIEVDMDYSCDVISTGQKHGCWQYEEREVRK